MPALPWKSLGRADPEREYLVLLSFLPLKHRRRIPWFLLHTLRIKGQLKRSKGLLGYSLYARPLAKRFWTLSAWEDEPALSAFVEAPPHVRTMAVMSPHMGKTKFVRWTAKGSQLPPGWDDALGRWGGG